MGNDERAMGNLVGYQTKKAIISSGITVAMFMAAQFLIPDHAVMSKEELENKTILPKRELALRKAFVVMTALALKGTIRTAIDLGTLISARRKPSLMHTASLLASAPSFLVTYKTIKQRLANGEGTLNFRDTGLESKELKRAGYVATGGKILHGLLLAKATIDAANKMPRLPM